MPKSEAWERAFGRVPVDVNGAPQLAGLFANEPSTANAGRRNSVLQAGMDTRMVYDILRRAVTIDDAERPVWLDHAEMAGPMRLAQRKVAAERKVTLPRVTITEDDLVQATTAVNRDIRNENVGFGTALGDARCMYV